MKLLITTTIFAFALGCGSAAPPVTEAESAETPTENAKVADSKEADHEHSEHSDKDAPRITLDDAKKAYDSGDTVFVDTRAAVFYQNERIKGALNVPSSLFEDNYESVPKGKKIIAYCSWPAEQTSARVVLKLKDKGYKNVFALIGGTKAWKNAGYPMEGTGVTNK